MAWLYKRKHIINKIFTFIITGISVFFYPYLLLWIRNCFNPGELECMNGEVYSIIFNTIFLIPAACLIQFLFNRILFNKPIS